MTLCLLLSILKGFHWHSLVFIGDHGFDIVLVYPCTFDTFFQYRSIRIYTHMLLVYLIRSDVGGISSR